MAVEAVGHSSGDCARRPRVPGKAGSRTRWRRLGMSARGPLGRDARARRGEAEGGAGRQCPERDASTTVPLSCTTRSPTSPASRSGTSPTTTPSPAAPRSCAARARSPASRSAARRPARARPTSAAPARSSSARTRWCCAAAARSGSRRRRASPASSPPPGIGYDAGGIRVPIVPAAVIFDLALGEVAWPDVAAGPRRRGGRNRERRPSAAAPARAPARPSARSSAWSGRRSPASAPRASTRAAA